MRSDRLAFAALALLGTSIGSALLALFQWMELVLVRSGETPFCAVGEALDCAAVWDSPFASAVHGLTGIPVAGWGFIYGALAVVLTCRLVYLLLRGGEIEGAVQSLRITAFAGVLATAVLAAVSFRLSVFCLTCIGTYLLTFGFAGVALFMLPAPARFSSALGPALGWCTGALAVLVALAVVPGMRTPKNVAANAGDAMQAAARAAGEGSSGATRPAAGEDGAAEPGSNGSLDGEGLTEHQKSMVRYVHSLPDVMQKQVVEGLKHLRHAPEIDTSRFQVRHRKGPADAPLKVVEFIDYLCPHCRLLVENLDRMDQMVAADSWSLEPRHFPLDSECNPLMTHSDGTGLHCMAAYAMICLEGNDRYFEVQKEMLAAQGELTKEKIVEIAGEAMPRGELLECMDSPGTRDKLRDDIDYAALFDPEGTPLLIVNGRKAPPLVPLLFLLNMNDGALESEAFDHLTQR